MIALLDVNVLIALLDRGHAHHRAAESWFVENHKKGWATCPVTINGFVRVVSRPAFNERRIAPAEAIATLSELCAMSGHKFWPAGPSLLDPDRFARQMLLGAGQITDAYLLAVAVSNGGALATFDRSISTKAVRGAEARHLLVLC